MKLGAKFVPELQNLESDEISEVIEQIKKGEIGKIIEVHDEGGEHVGWDMEWMEGLGGYLSPDERALPVEVIAAPAVIDPPALEPTAAKIEIVLPTGHRISVSGAYDADALCRLVRGLG